MCGNERKAKKGMELKMKEKIKRKERRENWTQWT